MKFESKISQELLHLGFWNLVRKHWVWLIVLCKRESASSCLSFPLFVHFFFLSNQMLCHRFRGSYESQSSDFSVYPDGQVYCGKWTNMLRLILPSLSISLSLTPVHREICVKYFSETKLLHLGFISRYKCCASLVVLWEREPASIYLLFPLCVLFLLSLQLFNIKVFQFLLFSLFTLSLTERPIMLKLGTYMDSGLMYSVYWNQAAGAYLFLFWFSFVSLIFPKKLSHFSWVLWCLQSWNVI